MKLKIWSIYKQDDSDRGVELYTSKAAFQARQEELIRNSPVGEEAVAWLNSGNLDEAWEEFCDRSEEDNDHYEADEQEVEVPNAVVRIDIRGGCAEVSQIDKGVSLEIRDYDVQDEDVRNKTDSDGDVYTERLFENQDETIS